MFKYSAGRYNELLVAAKRVSIIAEIITPTIAKKYLERNTNNYRRIRPSVVTNYARDMENDVWMLSWDCIAFSDDGELLNGQHRLEGIVASKQPQVCYVMRGCPKDLFFGDTGAKRTINDYLRHSGICENPVIYGNTGVGALNVMLKYLFTKRVLTPTSFDIQNLIDRMPNIDVFTSIIQIAKSGVKGVNKAAVIAAVYTAFVCTLDERVIAFMKELVSGIGQPTVINLRDKLITNAYGNGGSMPQVTTIKVTQRVIKAYLDGEKLSKLYIPTDIIYMLDNAIDWERGGSNDPD